MVYSGVEASTPSRVVHKLFVARYDELWVLSATQNCYRMELSSCYSLSSVLEEWSSDLLHVPQAEVDVVAATLCHCADSYLKRVFSEGFIPTASVIAPHLLLMYPRVSTSTHEGTTSQP